jgi:hypothetical protein
MSSGFLRTIDTYVYRSPASLATGPALARVDTPEPARGLPRAPVAHWTTTGEQAEPPSDGDRLPKEGR